MTRQEFYDSIAYWHKSFSNPFCERAVVIAETDSVDEVAKLSKWSKWWFKL